MIKRTIISLIVIGVFFTLVGSVSAQEDTPTGPVYILQSGDTLSRVAARFGLTVNDLIDANQIENPDNVPAGTSLVLPGLDWVDGTLLDETLPLGETYRTISRRYKMDPLTFARLNEVISPTQVGAGFTMLLASDGNEDWDAGRVAIPAQTSLTELAIASNTNPWLLVGANKLQGTWAAIPGDVLLTPGIGEPGPGALPQPITQVSFDGDTLVQGRTDVFRVSANGMPLELGGELIGHPLNFFDSGQGNYVAIQGVHAQAEPGLYPLSIQGTMEDGAAFNFTQLVKVADGGYGREEIEVEDYYLDDDINNTEFELLKSLVLPVTPEKYWNGYFSPPTIYSEVITSSFGTRRSYNGSDYTFFHSGVDYGGGVGVEIFAVAPGVVVFAQPLEVRGNATVIDHGWGVYSGYWHQSQINVEVGQWVEQGQVIGLVGGTGRSTGAHMHLELWVGGVQVDPLDWIYNVFP